MTCTECTKRNRASFTPFLGPETYRACMDDYEVCGAMHRDIERYNDDFEGIFEHLLGNTNLLDNEDKESIVTIQLMLASFVERIYNLQRDLSRASAESHDQIDCSAEFDAVCREFEGKAAVLYRFRESVLATPRTPSGVVEMAPEEWKLLIGDLRQGVSREYSASSRR